MPFAGMSINTHIGMSVNTHVRVLVNTHIMVLNNIFVRMPPSIHKRCLKIPNEWVAVVAVETLHMHSK